jgi:glutathione S-transferase
MSIVLHHHPYSRAANVVWMLEELGLPYELAWVDIRTGEQKSDAYRALNTMGKLPVLVDNGVAIAESAAIGVYLADRYALGRLAPALDDPARGPYLRWCVYAPSVIEPGCMAKSANWEYRAGAAGWGTYEEILATLEAGLTPGPWLLGEHFTMADVILGGTLRFMLSFKMIEPRPAFLAYVARINERPAAQRAQARNTQVAQEHGLGA